MGKATITIECIIQASDVAHTMQHGQGNDYYRMYHPSIRRGTYHATWARQRLLSNVSSKHQTWHIPCNIGMYTRDGIYACLRKCIRPLWRDGPIRIRPWVGTMVNYGSLIITSSR